jgi:hypothetical protein
MAPVITLLGCVHAIAAWQLFQFAGGADAFRPPASIQDAFGAQGLLLNSLLLLATGAALFRRRPNGRRVALGASGVSLVYDSAYGIGAYVSSGTLEHSRDVGVPLLLALASGAAMLAALSLLTIVLLVTPAGRRTFLAAEGARAE